MSGIRAPRVGLVLGSGSARGWAHIGVIRALEQAGVRPDLVCGTSIGSLVGAVYAAGELDRFEQWVLGLGVREVIAYIDISLGSGLLKGERLMSFFRDKFPDRPVQDLALPFAAVATSLHTGAEVWLREGSTLEAVRASIALPGLFSPVLCEGSVLVDGGLVNPVPVSLARAMGADVVIAVDLSFDMLGRHLRAEPPPDASAGDVMDWIRKLQESLGALLPAHSAEIPKMPSMLDVLASSINIMQVRINRSRMAGEPPDLIIAPRLAHLGLLDFHRAREAIEEGKQAVERVAHSLSDLNRM
ncbi:NTE family protein [Nitrosospira multiformis ATCC 25196]|uniref:NTE family protein n=1 Tax=Nitrosospira multiformis (strain ATCC 25196 / NCIMB 11849 / C 71) TaxID=323848 RepID=Q2YCP9_NITMU|nr:patatin-like phospholipase RssA [Nitrosospira multiformis]ABB73472.1 Patatin [Nitrosospira multiformis ATCC 25196]SEG10234.1 NTE family protein [Nitrosospira multiformis ATCC 25196]